MDEICTKMLKALGMVGLSRLTHLCNVAWSLWDGAFRMVDEGGGSCFYKGGLEGLQQSMKQSAASQNLENSWLFALG